MAAKRVVERYGTSRIILLFTDTLIEDPSLYRFLEDTTKFLGVHLEWLADGRNPWEVFRDEKYMGNSRIAPCSKILKYRLARKWLLQRYSPTECVLYMGFDWTELHRVKIARKNWAPYKVQFPLCVSPYLTKETMLLELERDGIKQPALYEMGFAHNNCGGFCCRAGQGHFAHLLEKKPELYRWHEEQEQNLRAYLQKDLAMLKRTVQGVTTPLTLRQLREEVQAKICEVDPYDIGGCGCFIDNGEEA